MKAPLYAWLNEARRRRPLWYRFMMSDWTLWLAGIVFVATGWALGLYL